MTESMSRRLAAETERTINRMEQQAKDYRDLFEEEAPVDVTNDDIYKQLTKIELMLEEVLRKAAAPPATAAPAARGAAPPAAGGRELTGVLQGTQVVSRPSPRGGTFDLLEVTLANGWKRTIPMSKADVVAYFQSKSPGDHICVYEQKNAKGFNEIVGIGS